MSTLLQFSRNIRSIGSRIENNSAKVVRDTSKAALRSLINGTPVDTGKARSNWRVGLGAPTRSVIPAYSPGKKLGRGERLNARAALAAGFARINQLRIGPVAGRAGKAVFITNSIPYLDELRRGSSTQQGNDWVGLALIEASTVIKSARLLRR